jgi:disulfide bond formation protein DsbB
MKHPSPRIIFSLIALMCSTLLAAAWHAQYGPLKLQPCPLCILQRYVYIVLGVVCGLAAAHSPSRNGMLVYAVVAEWVALAGAALAIWQVTGSAKMESCVADPIGVFVNGLPMVDWWPEFFFANGGCADVLPPVLGLQIPVWSLIWFLAFSLVMSALIVTLLRARIQDQRRT